MKQPRTDKPYFEVLIVEDLTGEQELALREELRHWRRPDDQFVYEIVVVPSFEDANSPRKPARSTPPTTRCC